MSAVLTAGADYRANMVRRHRLLSSAPLVALVDAEGGYAACAGPDMLRTPLERAWNRAKADEAVTWVAGDQLAVRLLGLHPLLVWGDEWLQVLRELDERPARSDRKLLQAV